MYYDISFHVFIHFIRSIKYDESVYEQFAFFMTNQISDKMTFTSSKIHTVSKHVFKPSVFN